MQNNNDKKDDISKRLEELKKQRREQNNKNNNNNQKPPYSKLPFILGLVLLILVLTTAPNLTDKLNTSMQNVKEIQYTEFINKIKDGQIQEVEEKDDFITTKLKENNKDVIYKARKITDRVGEDTNLMGVIESKNINLKVQQPTGPNYFWPLVFNFLPFVIIIGAFVYLIKKM